ncbi:C4-dicarboxylate ABC transporter substrate-binding protein [Actinokineospora fastidiosa]|uniref:C4-dicarboxylate ABC transporter substrate-binding protein n=1 Tax=Actinokineospora fastidiosa TaxID=1816 RepID=A0A918GTC1_9PSEU|nr:C4-dicarboxylate ABC transporter substrate-binding protein [Actinokineospora fastidiosa]
MNPQRSWTGGLTRRAVLRLGAGAIAAGIAGCGSGEYAGPARTLRIAAGERGGFYVEFAELLAGQLDRALGAIVVGTKGSAQNLGLLRTGGADLALALADIARGAAEGRVGFGEPLPVRAIGRVYENYMQLVVLADSPVASVADLAGRRVSLGADGSGAAIFGARLFDAADVAAAIEHNTLATAVERLGSGRVDALLWSGGVPTPALTQLAAAHPIRLIDLTDHLPALRADHDPAYHRVTVPAGSYGATRPVETVGVANLLVTTPDLPDAVAAAVARTLVRSAPRLIPPSALGTQYLDLRSLIVTSGIRLHPGAAAAYRELRR